LQVEGRNYDNLYNHKGYYKVEGVRYVQGENEILVTATDYSGNRTEKKFILNIRLDM
jgi:hypothetical protein